LFNRLGTSPTVRKVAGCIPLTQTDITVTAYVVCCFKLFDISKCQYFLVIFIVNLYKLVMDNNKQITFHKINVNKRAKTRNFLIIVKFI